MTQPLVSIVTPVFNDVEYIERCVRNVLDQSYGNIEHVIIDGGSSDGTLEILKKYKEQHPDRITFISEPDKGGDDAWNKGVKLARGEILGILGADDLFVDDAIEVVVDFFAAHPESKFIYGDYVTIDEKGDVVQRHGLIEFDFQDFVNTARHICTTSAFYKAEVMEKIGWLDSSGDDFDVLVRMARSFKPYGMDKVLSKFTARPNSAFNSPATFKELRKARKQSYEVSRKYGGSLFSPLAVRYYAIVIVDSLRLAWCYPFLRRIYQKYILRLVYGVYSEDGKQRE